MAEQSKPRQFVRMYVTSFTPEVIQGYVNARSKAAPLFEDICLNCKGPFTVRAYTALTQLKKYKRFHPPTHCKQCFDIARGVSVTLPPGNASIKHKEPAKYTPPIPEELDARELVTYNRKWQGKEVVLHFKQQVSFSDTDESATPDHGVVLSFAARALTVVDPDEELHKARTYPLKDIERIESFEKLSHVIARAAAAEAWEGSASTGVITEGHDAEASAQDHGSPSKGD